MSIRHLAAQLEPSLRRTQAYRDRNRFRAISGRLPLLSFFLRDRDHRTE